MGRNADYVAHLAQREHAGESSNYDSMGEAGQALRQARLVVLDNYMIIVIMAGNKQLTLLLKLLQHMVRLYKL